MMPSPIQEQTNITPVNKRLETHVPSPTDAKTNQAFQTHVTNPHNHKLLQAPNLTTNKPILLDPSSTQKPERLATHVTKPHNHKLPQVSNLTTNKPILLDPSSTSKIERFATHVNNQTRSNPLADLKSTYQKIEESFQTLQTNIQLQTTSSQYLLYTKALANDLNRCMNILKNSMENTRINFEAITTQKEALQKLKKEIPSSPNLPTENVNNLCSATEAQFAQSINILESLANANILSSNDNIRSLEQEYLTICNKNQQDLQTLSSLIDNFQKQLENLLQNRQVKKEKKMAITNKIISLNNQYEELNKTYETDIQDTHAKLFFKKNHKEEHQY